MKPPCPRLGDLGGEDLSNDRSKDLCVHGSPKEREQEVLVPFSLGRRVGEGLPHFVRRAKDSRRRSILE